MSTLANVRVLDLTQTLAGPFCTMVLGDMGADIIKIEAPPHGDPQRMTYPMVDGVSAGFYALNRNKRSLPIDLKQPAGREVFYRLVAQADVLVENYRVGVTKRLGLDFETLSEINPALVYASISGFGQYGPYSHLGGYDPVVQAVTGLMSATGPEGGDPVKISVPITDIGAGLMATTGILCAYIHRLKSGRGQYVDASLFDTGLAFSVWEIVAQLHAGVTPRPLGTRHRLVAPIQAFRTADGQVMIAVANDRLWQRFTRVLERPELAEDPRFARKVSRSEHVRELTAVIEEQTCQKTTADWVESLQAAGIPCGPIKGYDEVVHDPHVLAREMLVDLPHPNGRPIRIPGMPIKLSATPGQIRRRPPMFGEHAEEVLSEFGFSAAEIQALRASSVIAIRQ